MIKPCAAVCYILLVPAAAASEVHITAISGLCRPTGANSPERGQHHRHLPHLRQSLLHIRPERRWQQVFQTKAVYKQHLA